MVSSAAGFLKRRSIRVVDTPMAANAAVSERLFAQGLCLPSGTAMTEADLDRVCDGIRRLRR